MLARVLVSPRRRRRLGRIGFAVVALAALGAAVALMPRGYEARSTLRPGSDKPAAAPKPLHLTAADRRAIDRTLDRFVPAGIERRDLADAYRIATPAFRAGASLADWRRGDVPLFPYTPRNRNFHDWSVNYAEGNLVNIDLLLQARKNSKLGDVMFTFDLRRVGRTWHIDSAVPIAVYAPAKKAPQIKASPDFTPGIGQTVQAGTHRGLDPRWLLVPASLLALVFVVPIGIGIVRWRRSAAAYRRGVSAQRP